MKLGELTFQTTGVETSKPALSDEDLIAIANKLGVSKADAEGYAKNYEIKDADGKVVNTITKKDDHNITYSADIIAGEYKATISIQKDGKTLLNVIKMINVTYPEISIEKVQGWWNDKGDCVVEGRVSAGKWNMEVALNEVLKLKDAKNGETLSFEVTDKEETAIATLIENVLTLNSDADLSKNNTLNFKAIIKNEAGTIISETNYKVTFKNPLPNELTATKKEVTLYNKLNYNTLSLIKTETPEEKPEEKPGIGINLESGVAEPKAVITDGVPVTNNVFGAEIRFELKTPVEGLEVSNDGKLTWRTTATGAVFTEIKAVVIVKVTTRYGEKTMDINVTILGAEKVPAE